MPCSRSSVASYDASKSWLTQAAYSNVPTCPDTFLGWTIRQEKVKCSGTAQTSASGTWKDCVALATSSCTYAISWDKVNNICYRYAYAECGSVSSDSNFHTFKFYGPSPNYAPTISGYTQTRKISAGYPTSTLSTKTSSTKTRVSGDYTTWTISWTDTLNCASSVATDKTFSYEVTLGKDGSTTTLITGTTALKAVNVYYLDSDTKAASAGVVSDLDGISKYWFKVTPFYVSKTGTGQRYYGPSGTCSAEIDSALYTQTDINVKCT